jgi:hypothetical protein
MEHSWLYFDAPGFVADSTSDASRFQPQDPAGQAVQVLAVWSQNRSGFQEHEQAFGCARRRLWGD